MAPSSKTKPPALGEEDVVVFRTVQSAAYVIINRPEARNALSNEVLLKLRLACARAKEDPSVRAVVLASADGRCFSAGGDLAEMEKTSADSLDAHEGRAELGRLFEDLWALGKPTIAKVDGYALGGGFGLALACDFVLASAESSFGTPEVKRGLFPYMITVPMLRSMPPKTALRLMLTGARIPAEEGATMGFVTEVAEPGALDDLTERYLALLLEASPQAIKVGRTAFYRVLDTETSSQLEYLWAHLAVTLGTEDAAEGMRAFLENREPSWSAGATGTS